MKGILVGSSGKFNRQHFIEESRNADLVVAVDGGLKLLDEIGIKPDVLIGDFDSIDQDSLEKARLKENIIIEEYPKEKDSTDMELALDYLISKGVKDICIFAGLGNRLDHSLANILLLDRLNNLGVFTRIIGDYNTIFLVDGTYQLEKEEGKFISILPITDYAEVSLKGFKYNLDRYRIKFTSTIGVSNEIVDQKGYVHVHSGRVLIFISKD